ncbi:MAG TPA: lipid-A-disaccharide synthase [Verrucomicrobiae bacterium]|jgi:lipid-A-disaccharide synthase|nr:lipid-A-disaccharide synthase [Verrucomicrobiae bacterium]
MTPKRFMIIAGEASGDVLAAELVKELRDQMFRRYQYSSDLQPLYADLAPRFFGAGGPCMAKADVELAFDLTEHSVTGLWDVLKNYFKFRRLFNQLLAMAREREPHIIICVDFSGFNRRFAAAIKNYVRARRGTFNNWEPKIIQYISPQVWASRADRAYQVARDVDLLLSIFPFEKDWYAKKVPKLRVEFVGHPLIDRHQGNGARGSQFTGQVMRNPGTNPTIVLLPGSRPGELERHLPPMLDALKILQSSIPNLRARLVLPADSLIAQAKNHSLPTSLEIQCGNLAEALSQADLAIASTGTVTMECAYFGVPTVTIYKALGLSWGFRLGIIKVKWLTMPNILANEELFPEFLQNAATPENIARAALGLLRDPARREKIRSRLSEVIASLGPPGASRRAAHEILKLLAAQMNAGG